MAANDFITPQLLGIQSEQPAAPEATSGQNKPGPVKRFFSNFLMGSGDAMRAHVGLETSAEEEARKARESVAQQQANTLEGYRQAQAAGIQAKADQLDHLNSDYTFDANDTNIPEQFRGLKTTVAGAQALMKVFAQNQGKKDVAEIQGGTARDVAETRGGFNLKAAMLHYGPGGSGNHQVTNVNGRAVLVDKRDGSVVKDLGPSNALTVAMASAHQRAVEGARYGLVNTPDSEGNPVSISRLDALRTGAPSMTEQQSMNLAGSKVGVQTYLQASENVEKNLHVLRDPVQRAIIAKATDAAEHGGPIDAILQSAMQQGLSPEGAALIGGLKQMNEFGASFKAYTGNNGVATDSLRSTIHGNQASASNNEAVNLQLLRQDRDLANRVQQNLTKPTSHAPQARGANVPRATAQPASTSDPFARFGGKAR